MLLISVRLYIGDPPTAHSLHLSVTSFLKMFKCNFCLVLLWNFLVDSNARKLDMKLEYPFLLQISLWTESYQIMWWHFITTVWFVSPFVFFHLHQIKLFSPTYLNKIRTKNVRLGIKFHHFYHIVAWIIFSDLFEQNENKEFDVRLGIKYPPFCHIVMSLFSTRESTRWAGTWASIRTGGHCIRCH